MPSSPSLTAAGIHSGANRLAMRALSLPIVLAQTGRTTCSCPAASSGASILAWVRSLALEWKTSSSPNSSPECLHAIPAKRLRVPPCDRAEESGEWLALREYGRELLYKGFGLDGF